MRRVLIAEDDPQVGRAIMRGLEAGGFGAKLVDDGGEALILAEGGNWDLLILDLGLPTIDGLTVLNRLRATGSDVPVIILTGSGDVGTKVSGLEGGADDYMTKPFAMPELIARVKARIRGGGEHALEAGGMRLDLRTRRAEIDGRKVDLSAREFSLLEVLIRHPDQVLSRQQLLSSAWEMDFEPGSNVVAVYVRYLREKLGDDAIETVRGAGYRLRADRDDR